MTDLMPVELPRDELLPDHVWRQLDPHAARLSRRRSAQIALGSAVLLMLVAAAYGLWRSGWVVPRVDDRGEADYYSWSAGTDGRIGFELPVTNDGFSTIVVTSIGRSGPGLTFEQPSNFPLTLAPGQSTIVAMAWHVTDCAAVPRGDWPVPLTIRRWWGSQTVQVLPGGITSDTPSEYSYSGTDPYAHPWQEALTKLACAPTK